MITEIQISLIELFRINPWLFFFAAIFFVLIPTSLFLTLCILFQEFQRRKTMGLTPEFWGRYFKTYDILNRVIPYRELLQALCEELEIQSEECILEAGSGTGNLVLEIEKYGAIVVGFDFSKIGLRVHKEKKPDACVVLGDLVYPLPFRDCAFDKIVSSNTLYLISPEKRVNVMQEFFRILKPGGKIVITNLRKGFKPRSIYFNHIQKGMRQMGIPWAAIEILSLIVPTIKMLYYNYFIQKEARKDSFRFFNPDEQEKLFKESGFTDISKTKSVFSSGGILTSALKPERGLRNAKL